MRIRVIDPVNLRLHRGQLLQREVNRTDEPLSGLSNALGPPHEPTLESPRSTENADEPRFNADPHIAVAGQVSGRELDTLAQELRQVASKIAKALHGRQSIE